MEQLLEVTFDDDRKPDNEKFANLVDPVLWSIFIRRTMSTDEKRSLSELVTALMEGK
jgi:hypothetical protein